MTYAPPPWWLISAAHPEMLLVGILHQCGSPTVLGAEVRSWPDDLACSGCRFPIRERWLECEPLYQRPSWPHRP